MYQSHKHTHIISAMNNLRVWALRSLASLVLLGILIFMNSGSVFAQTTAFAVNNSNDILYSINLNTGAVTQIGSGIGFFDVTALSFSPGGVLYGIDSNNDVLITINTTTGNGTLVGALTVDISSDAGLTFDASGNLWLSDNGGGNRFFQVNPVTGVATFIGDLGEGNVEGLAALGNVIYGLGEDNNRIGTINTATGAFTPIGSLGFNVGTDLGIDFAPGGVLWGVDSSVDSSNQIFSINTATGVGTLVATIQQGGSWESLAIAGQGGFTVMNPAVSDQKAGSVLVFPYYNSSPTGTTADTLIQISNVCNGAGVSGGVPNYSYLHLFFMKGCSPADTYACLTPNGSLNILASVYDPGVEGYLIAVAVDANGVPVQNNCFIGSAYVRDDNTSFADSYGAEAFWKYATSTAPVTSGYAAINLNGAEYDAAPTQFAVQVQDPAVADEYVVLASVNGNLGSSLSSVSQSGFGIVYRADETPASFQPQLNSGCLSITLIDAGKIRVATANGGYNNFLKDSYGYLKFNVTSPAVGLLISRQGAAGQLINRFSGIRTLHKTQVGSATLSLPVFPPFCF